ncbi:MAG: hypothetical protein ACI4RA_05770 [Kiritimatiellia bacterium]
MAEQKNEQKKYVDPNRYAGYGAAMASVPGDPMAVEWQAAEAAKIAEATAPKALAGHVWDAASAEALLAKVKGAYTTDALTLTVIGAVSQYVMEPMIGRADGCQKRCSTPGAAPCQRKIWNMALIGAFRKTKDEYIQTFLLDQLRWCGCACRTKDIRALADVAASANVKAYIDWTAAEVAGATLPAK